ncbi:hypothetical protein ElyMa_004920900 [Elysia marginata]|uniref:Reverse transcriptase zinc-binding domain-containing protein n=1 Tax=Elysia marginata TaxID=1093978 RepID=A0AAV4IWP3_9GAST|nr:hypothetical protein ElyMa_004920900 [Elysia marginata]
MIRESDNSMKSDGLIIQHSTSLGQNSDVVHIFCMQVNHNTLLQGDMHRRNWGSTACCRLCDSPSETVQHVLFDCPALTARRPLHWHIRDL